MAALRIYVITNEGANRLVRASHPATALMHVARSEFVVRVATQDDLVELLKAGVSVEAIDGEQQQIET